jgi:hypothetical protein
MKRILIDKREREGCACYAVFESAGEVGQLRENRGDNNSVYMCTT